MADLSEKFKNIPEDSLQEILSKFCRISLSDRHATQFSRGANNKSQPPTEGANIKFMKSKDAIKTLTLTIIGLVVHLSTQGKSKGYFIERILKKTGNDLKSFYQELGMHCETTKRKDKETGKEMDDVTVYFSNAVVNLRKKKEVQEEQKEEWKKKIGTTKSKPFN